MPSGSNNICLIGGGGFIGTALRHYLSGLGYNITSIGRTLNVPLTESEEYFSVREYSYKQLQEILGHTVYAAVIDLAYTSVPNTSFDDPVKDFSENLYNVIQHLEFTQTLKGSRYIYVSSGGTVYGDSEANQPFHEEDPNFPLSPYGITKLACERYVYLYHRIHGMNTVIVRPSNIYGPGQRPFRGQGLISTALGLILKGEPIHVFGKGDNVRDYLFIDDFCAAMVDVLDHALPGGVYNIGYGEGHTILDIIHYAEKAVSASGFEMDIKYNPDRPFDVKYNVLDREKISSLNNWQPVTTLEAGITKTWTWIKEYLKDNP